MRPVLEVISVPPFEVNVYLVGDASTGHAVVIDPGGAAREITDLAAAEGLTIGAIVATHAHVDHVSGAAELSEVTGAPFKMHRDGVPLLSAIDQQTRMFGLPSVEQPVVDDYIEDGQTIQVGGIRLTVHDTPGHAPGHITLVGDEIDLGSTVAPFALCGDVIFQGSIGRVDLPGGDFDLLMRSIERVILTMPDNTVLLSGHGPATTVGHERRTNPFVLEWISRRRG